MSVNLNCSLCRNTQSVSKLPCEHAFCARCIRNKKTSYQEGMRFKCTKCFREFLLKESSPQALDEGYIVQRHELPSVHHTPFRIAVTNIFTYISESFHNDYRRLQ